MCIRALFCIIQTIEFLDHIPPDFHLLGTGIMFLLKVNGVSLLGSRCGTDCMIELWFTVLKTFACALSLHPISWQIVCIVHVNV
jgi:hypothetical protein